MLRPSSASRYQRTELHEVTGFKSCPPCCEVTVNISEVRRRIGALRATLRVSYTWIRQIIHQPYYARPTSTPTPSTVSTHVLVHRSAIDPPCDRIGRCSSRAPSGRVLRGSSERHRKGVLLGEMGGRTAYELVSASPKRLSHRAPNLPRRRAHQRRSESEGEDGMAVITSLSLVG